VPFTKAIETHVLALFRIVVGLLFAVHGMASIFGVLGGAPGTNGGTIPPGTWPGWYAALIQLVGGALVVLGAGRSDQHRLDGVRVPHRAR
jgi:putative oxidoreductase